MSTLQNPRIEFLDLCQVFSQTEPDIDFVLPGFIAGTVGVLSAPGSSGKSWWALEALCAVAGGLRADLLDLRPAAHGRVIYLCLEDLQIVLVKRLCKLREHFSDDVRALLLEQLHILPLAGQRIDMRKDRVRDWLAGLCTDARLCVVDTLSRVHDADENDNSEMSQLLSNFEFVSSRTGCAILLTHHVRKSGAGEGPAQQAARGASALIDNARWAAALNGMTEAESDSLVDPDYGPDPLNPMRIGERKGWYVKYTVTKANYSPPQAGDVWYRRAEGGVLIPARLEPLARGPRAEFGAVKRAASTWKGRPEKE